MAQAEVSRENVNALNEPQAPANAACDKTFKPIALPNVDPAELKLGPPVGVGHFSYVHKSTHKGRPVAVKRARESSVRTPEERWLVSQTMQKEAEFLGGLDHPNIIKAFGVCLDHETPMMLLEMMGGGTVQQRIDNHSFTNAGEIVFLALDLAMALEYLHCHGVVHRDLKPSNMMFDDSGVLKLIDLGFARVEDPDGRMTPQIGTLRYIAPEIFRSEEYGRQADIFSFGIVMWEIITGSMPYPQEQLPAQAAKKVAYFGLRPDPLPESKFCPKALADLLVRCWAENASERPTATEIAAELRSIYMALPPSERTGRARPVLPPRGRTQDGRSRSMGRSPSRSPEPTSRGNSQLRAWNDWSTPTQRLPRSGSYPEKLAVAYRSVSNSVSWSGTPLSANPTATPISAPVPGQRRSITPLTRRSSPGPAPPLLVSKPFSSRSRQSSPEPPRPANSLDAIREDASVRAGAEAHPLPTSYWAAQGQGQQSAPAASTGRTSKANKRSKDCVVS